MWRTVIISGAALLAAMVSKQVRAGDTTDHLLAYNLTSATDFTGVYLAPAGTRAWSGNQALNVVDKVLDTSRRVTLTGVAPGKYDVKLVDSRGHTCVLPDIDLASRSSFEIRDPDLAACR